MVSEMWVGLWVEVFGATLGNLLCGASCAILHLAARIRAVFQRYN
jgi:hypothetical protein